MLLTGSALGLVLLALLVPWRNAVEVPAMLEAARIGTLHAPIGARVKAVRVKDGDTVEQGALLMELESPDLDARQGIVRREIDILQLQLRRQSGRSETAAGTGVIEQQLAEAVAEYRGLAAKRERLQFRAPMAGVVRDLPPDLVVGRWAAQR